MWFAEILQIVEEGHSRMWQSVDAIGRQLHLKVRSSLNLLNGLRPTHPDMDGKNPVHQTERESVFRSDNISVTTLQSVGKTTILHIGR
jgi:hypothetical protein